MDQIALAMALKKMGEIPALPNVTTEVLELINDPSSHAQDICNVIVKDQALTTKVLRLVNSAYYGLPRKVSTISEAITVLGLQTLRTLVLGVSVYKTLGTQGKNGVLNPEQTWKHSIASAVASKLVASRLEYPKLEQAFIAGLLHDIGKMVLSNFMTEEYLEVMRRIEEEDISLLKAERETLNLDHALVGKLVAEKWNLPDSLVEPIAYHHDPLTPTEYRDLACIVHLGNAAAVIAGFGLGNDKDYHLHTKVMSRIGFTFNQVVNVSSELEKLVKSDMLL